MIITFVYKYNNNNNNYYYYYSYQAKERFVARLFYYSLLNLTNCELKVERIHK